MNVLDNDHENHGPDRDPERSTDPAATFSSLGGQGFAERLLQLGEIDPHDHGQGHQVFRLIKEVFPIESQIFARAADRLLDLLEEQGAADDELQQTGTEARLLLGLTLVPFVRLYANHYVNGSLDNDADPLVTFRRLARPWALAQMKNAAAYIVTLELQEQQRQSRQGGLDSHALELLAHCKQVIEEHGDRPEAAPLVEKATIEYRLLTEKLAQHAQLNPARERTLSYLLSCTSGGQLKDLALAALILRGNASPGAEAVANPLQLLDVQDVASVLNLERGKVTSGVSKLRRRAASHSSIAFNRQTLNPQQLWGHVHVHPSDAVPAPTSKD